jgi:hypothetical protein
MQPDRAVVFASIQKLSRPENLARIAAERFDYVVVDEVHHADAPTYRFERRAAQVELVDQFPWICCFIGMPLVGRVRLGLVHKVPAQLCETPWRLQAARIPQ